MTTIDRVAYERLRSFGNYENERVRAEASVAPGEDPEYALADIQRWVTDQLDRRGMATLQRDRLEDKTYEIKRAEADLEALKGKAEKVRAFLERHGVAVDDFSDLPF